MEYTFYDLFYLSYATFPMIILGGFIYYLITKKKCKSPHVCKPSIDFELITNEKQLKQFIDFILFANVACIGVDAEFYRGNKYYGKLCTLQFSISEKILNKDVFIVDLLVIDKFYASTLLNRILSNENIEKVFHACTNDIEWIFDELNIVTKNIFDTQEAYQIIKRNSKKSGLDELLNEYFNLNISHKDKKEFQKSNWEKRPLSIQQLNYAAIDSYYLVKLRKALLNQLTSDDLERMKTQRQRQLEEKLKFDKHERNENKAINYFISNVTKCDIEVLEKLKKIYIAIYRINDEYAWKNNINPETLMNNKLIYRICRSFPKTQESLYSIISEMSPKILEHHEELVEIVSSKILEFSNSIQSEILELDEDIHTVPIEKAGKLSKEAHKIIVREKTVQRFSCKKPVYESCKMLAPDDELLCFCDTKKMNWYIQRNLAELISDDPPAFRLIFEPNARGCSDLGDIPSSFYLKDRKNCCVVCGSKTNYMRFHVVPILYRQYFPNELKSHKAHDVILLCFNCHEKANKLYDIKKREIAEHYQIPIILLSEDQKEYKQLELILKHAKTIHMNYHLMPLVKRLQLSKTLLNLLIENKANPRYLDFYDTVFTSNGIPLSQNENDINENILEKMKAFKLKGHTHGERKNFHGKLIVEKIKDFTLFIREWRTFFKESLQPKYLPDSWNVEHEFYRTFGDYSKFKKNDGIV